MDGPHAEMQQKDDAAACAGACQEENVAKLKQGMYFHKTLSTSARVTAEDQPATLSKDDESHTMPREATIAQPAETPKEEVLSDTWNNFEEIFAAETQEDLDKVNANFDIDSAAEVIRGDNMSNHTVVEELIPATRDEAVAEAASDGTKDWVVLQS